MFGYLFGAYLDPDSDQINLTGADGRAIRKFGILGIMWVMYWMPYAWVMPHRSFFSHFPVVSTIIRDLYILLPVVAVLYYFYFDLYEVGNIVLPYLTCFILGQSMSDGVHYFLDISS